MAGGSAVAQAPSPAAARPTAALPAPTVAPVVPPRPNPSDVMKNWPAYPEALRHTGQQGTVLLQVRIDTQGVPREIGIARSSNVVLLDQSAVLAVRQWRFSPATQGGQPVEATVRLPIDFKLKDPPPPAPATQGESKAAAKTPPAKTPPAKIPPAKSAKPAQPPKPAAQKPKTAAEPKAPQRPRAAQQAAPRETAPAGERQGLERPPSLTLPPPQ